MSAPLYPLFADLAAKRVLVVGGGKVAERKVAALLGSGAEVVVGSPELTANLANQARAGSIQHRPGRFTQEWLEHAWLVVAATGNKRSNAKIAEAAHARQRLVNVVDDLALSSFHVPATVIRGALQIAISSGGKAPAIARRVRARLEAHLDESLAGLLALSSRYRAHIKQKIPSLSARRQFFDWLLDGPVAGLLRRNRSDKAERELLLALDTPRQWRSTGRVSLVGAGPGDPGLLTLKAQRALQQADIILHDRLVSADILQLARRDAESIAVGKQVGDSQDDTQNRIHDAMLHHARRGLHVVRLKGGDPFIFGRGGEELEFLRAHDVDYEVIPGITAASACAAYAGIPLTHREHAQSVHMVTAHCRKSLDTLDWSVLAANRQTLAVYMGVAQLPHLTRKLLAHGRAATTPFALIENGSRPEQRLVHGQLQDLPRLARHHAIRAPSMLILGEVAALAASLGWYGTCNEPMIDAAQAA